MFKLIALGTLGYVGYRFLRHASAESKKDPELRLAGGPLSANASVQSSADTPPLATF